VTNLTLPSRAVVRFYNKWGTAEQWIKEGKQSASRIKNTLCEFRFRCVAGLSAVLKRNIGHYPEAKFTTTPAGAPSRKIG